jgi:cyclopropane-fatty-acyl-phospholipid synthase
MRRLMLDGDIGLAEAYRDGDFTTPDLTASDRAWGAQRRHAAASWSPGHGRRACSTSIRHWRNANSRAGSRRNIAAHYDLGNDFYRHWLDAGMTYSSALYEAPADTLEAAQERKLDRIVEMLALTGGEHILEIGCGWGALAERLAREGCRVTAITLSPSQLAYAQRRVAQRPAWPTGSSFACRTTATLTGRYDRIVSIEMIEAVGRDYWPSYFATLKPLADGRWRPCGACRRSPSTTLCSSRTSRARTSFSASSSRAAACPRFAALERRCERVPVWRRSDASHSARATPRR